MATAAAKNDNDTNGDPEGMKAQETTMAAPEPKEKPKGIEFYGGYEVYSESGVDLTLLRSNLVRSIEERLETIRRSAEFGYALWQSNPYRELLISSLNRSLSMTDAAAFLKLFAAHDVQFVLIGGQALVAHGSAYVTYDTDICYQRTPVNLAALVAAFATIHPYLRGVPPGLPFCFDVPTIEAGLNFTLDTDYGKIDILGEVSGVGSYDQVLAQSVEKTIYGSSVRILSLDGLIAAKKAAGRTKDQLHLLELLELKKMLEAAKPSRPTEEAP
jgi:predicted nucleotidyltransferase